MSQIMKLKQVKTISKSINRLSLVQMDIQKRIKKHCDVHRLPHRVTYSPINPEPLCFHDKYNRKTTENVSSTFEMVHDTITPELVAKIDESSGAVEWKIFRLEMLEFGVVAVNNLLTTFLIKAKQ